MDQRLTKIKQCEARIEQALWSVEVVGDNEGALEAYKAAEADRAAQREAEAKSAPQPDPQSARGRQSKRRRPAGAARGRRPGW
jgi:hypothetical protein